MPGQLSKAVKSARAAQAQKIADKLELDFLASQVGEILPVVFETGSDGSTRGHSDNYCEVEVKGNVPAGVVRNVKILETNGKMLVGEIV